MTTTGPFLDIRQTTASHSPRDRNGLVLLERGECLRLLSRGTLGRVALTMGALPTILPVTYRLIDGDVVFRTGVGEKLAAATRHAVVAFEVDAFDAMSHAGWSVMVTGVTEQVTSVPELVRLEGLGVPRWLPARDDRIVRLIPDLISGRRLDPTA